MEILNSESLLSNKLKKHNPIPEILNRIFSICKTDPNFPLKDKLISVEGSLDSVRSKINNQNKLFEKSKEMKDDIQRKINILESENNILQEELLESLGSEL